jgi:hypothetical protein
MLGVQRNAHEVELHDAQAATSSTPRRYSDSAPPIAVIVHDDAERASDPARRFGGW